MSTVTIKQQVAEMLATKSRKITRFGHSAELRTARRAHWCDTRNTYPNPCTRRIDPGTRYVRSVMFPNHDASGYDVPVTHAVCLNCARNYIDLDVLAELAEAIAERGTGAE